MSQQNKKQTQTSLSAPFDQYIDEKLREEITGVSRTTWWRLERQGKTPPVYRIGQMRRWLLSEVLEWRFQHAYKSFVADNLKNYF